MTEEAPTEKENWKKHRETLSVGYKSDNYK
jgi:hypothetical protein